MTKKRKLKKVFNTGGDRPGPDVDAYPYYMVWGATRKRAPQVRHETESAAYAEAQRLAELHPGRSFYVLCVVGSRRAERVETTEAATA